MAALRDLLNDWDPIGVVSWGIDDEYDCLLPLIVARLDRGDGVDELTRFLRAELEDHFGLDVPPQDERIDRFARRAVDLRDRPTRAVVLITGMSGTGKSTMLEELARRGHRVVDTDLGGWIDDSGPEPLWRADRIDALLAGHEHGPLFVAGTVANQGTFSSRFDAIVLLSAPLGTILERVATRVGNDFGKDPAERARIVDDHATVEPLLRAAADVEFDTRRQVGEVADELERVAYSGGCHAHEL